MMPTNGTRVISDVSQAYRIASAPGFKGIHCKNEASVIYLTAGVALEHFRNPERIGNLGAATGATHEPIRACLGNPKLMMEYFGGALPVDRIPVVCPLDNYSISKEEYERLEREVGPEIACLLRRVLPWEYTGEHHVWMQGAGFKPEQLIAPPIRFTTSAFEAARTFDSDIKGKVGETELQFWGSGMHGHGGFDERWCAAHPSQMLTHLALLHASTLYNNAAPFAIPGEPRMPTIFRNIMGAYQLSHEHELVQMCDRMRRTYNGKMPRELDFVSQSLFEDFLKNFDRYWQRAQTIIGRMPQFGITRGIGDNYSKFHVINITNFHKRWALKHGLEDRKVNADWPITGLREKRSAVFIFDDNAAGRLEHPEWNYVFEPDTATDRAIGDHFTFEAADKSFWESCKPKVVW
ncbi:MAG: hypothetical protein WC527_04310 [Candidatus Margulisiibacteriota bacterium]